MKKPLTKMLLLCLFVIAGCGSDKTSNNSTAGFWTWMAGENSTSQSGSYGSKGTPSPTNKPGARYGAVSWTDYSGNMWLFGGYGYASGGASGPLNDLWKWDGTNWIWVAGDDEPTVSAIYGTKGITSANSTPGARYGAVSWIDNSGNLLMFGGYGYTNTQWPGYLNDLWRYR